MMPTPFAPTEAISFGWQTVKKNVALLLPLSLLQLVVMSLEGGSARDAHGSNAAVHLAAQVAGLVLAMGWWRVALRLHDGQPVGLAAVAELSLPQFLTYFLTTLMCGIVVATGFVLLIVPGVLWAIRFGFAPLVVIDEGLDPIASMRRSAALTHGVRADLFVFGLLLAGLNLLGVLALGIGVVVTMPVSVIAVTFVYRRLKARAAEVESSRPRPDAVATA